MHGGEIDQILVSWPNLTPMSRGWKLLIDLQGQKMESISSTKWCPEQVPS